MRYCSKCIGRYDWECVGRYCRECVGDRGTLPAASQPWSTRSRTTLHLVPVLGTSPRKYPTLP
eukprot:555647-Rhodomonas_salina.1